MRENYKKLEIELKEKRKEIVRRLEAAITFKKKLLIEAEKTLDDYKNGAISYERYREILDECLDKRTREQWIRYYDSYVENCRVYIEEIDRQLEECRKESKRRAVRNIGLVVGLMMVVVLALTMYRTIQPTGFAVAPLNVTVLNLAPNATNLQITPTTAYTNDTLTCSGSLSDWNADSVSAYYKWYSNSTGSKARLSYATSYLASGNFTSSNNITCSIVPYDSIVNGTARNASRFISNKAPVMQTVEITNNGSSYALRTVTPVEGTRARVAIRALVTDGDCSKESNVTAYICNTTKASSCGASSYTYYKVLSYYKQGASNSQCYFTYNGTSNMPQFWMLGGAWNLTVVARDNSSGGTTSNNFSSFTYQTLKAINYPTRVYLGNGSIKLGGWSVNSTAVNVTNYGNDVLNLTWNISNPQLSSGADIWVIDGKDFQVDDDSSYSSQSSDQYLRTVNLSNAGRSFFPASGLQRCISDNCNEGAWTQFIKNESMPTYFHIKPPLGLTAGTYSTTVWITLNSYP